MVDAAREPNAFQIDDKRLPVGIVLLSVVVRVDVFQDLPYLQAVLAVLVPEDVPSEQGCLSEMIDEQFLPERQKLEARHVVAQQLDVGKALCHCFLVCFVFLFGAAFLAFFFGLGAGGRLAFGTNPCCILYSFGVVPQIL